MVYSFDEDKNSKTAILDFEPVGCIAIRCTGTIYDAFIFGLLQRRKRI